MKKISLLILLLLFIGVFSNTVLAKNLELPKSFLEVANQKLVQMGLDKKVDTMKSLNGSQEDSYILFELEDSGYMIYYKEAEVFLEITPSVISPYKNSKGDLYYFGVGQYQLNEESFEYQVAYEASMKNTISRNIINSKKLLDDDNNSTIASTTSTTSTTNGDVEILFGWYFDWLQENMPENYYGECGYVALAVYLGYFDQMFNNYVVPTQYENDIDDPSEPTGTNQDFHDYLIELDGRDPSDPNGNFGSTALRIKNLTWDYLESNENVDQDDFLINWSFIPLNNTIRNAIDNDTPSIIFFGGHVDEVWPNEYVYHTAIAYGYNDDMFIVNLCLQGDNDYSRYYLSEFTVGSYMKMSYSPSSC